MQQHAEEILFFEVFTGISDDDFEAHGFGAGAQHGNGLRKAMPVDKITLAGVLRQPPRHGHGFRGGGRFVQQRGIGDLHAGQVDDHLLEIQQRLQAALADFRLVRGIGRIPAGILQDVALDHRGHDGVVVAQPDHRGEDLVARAHFAHVIDDRALADGFGERQWFRVDQTGGNGPLDQFLQVTAVQRGQHLFDLLLVGSDMAVDEVAAHFQLVQGGLL